MLIHRLRTPSVYVSCVHVVCVCVCVCVYAVCVSVCAVRVRTRSGWRLRTHAHARARTRAQRVMKSPVLSVGCNTSTLDAFQLMVEKNISGLAVTDEEDGKLVHNVRCVRVCVCVY